MQWLYITKEGTLIIEKEKTSLRKGGIIIHKFWISHVATHRGQNAKKRRKKGNTKEKGP